MSLKVTIIFICAGLTGVLSIKTVEHVSMEVGRTVQIPCQYEDKYKGHVKYLCWGYKWRSCATKIRSDQTNSRKYSINDDKTQRIVTFTINNLVSGDSDYYWCNVEIRNGGDDGRRFQLSVTGKGESRLHVDSQRITGYFGEQVTINFRYKGSESKQWCRFGGSCLRSSGQIDGAGVTIDGSVPGLFAVTMTGLQPQNIGWYWCSFGDLQMPVFVHLTQRPTTTTTKPTTTTTTTTAAAGATPASSTSVHPVPYYLTAAGIALGLLTFIVVVSLVVWFVLRRNMKKTKGPQSERDQDVVYSDINHRKRSPNKKKGPQREKDQDVVYSDIIRRDRSPSKKKDNPPEVSVIYSSVKARDATEQMTESLPVEANVIYSTVHKL